MARSRVKVLDDRRALVAAAKATRLLERRAADAREELHHAMAEAYRSGMTMEEIGAIVGLSRRRVGSILRG
jgi:DNA-binding transcriptional regulator LsrR (DeoR family)